MDALTATLGIVLIGAGALIVATAPPEAPKPREFPLWCHNGKQFDLSAPCSKTKVQWDI